MENPFAVKLRLPETAQKHKYDTYRVLGGLVIGAGGVGALMLGAGEIPQVSPAIEAATIAAGLQILPPVLRILHRSG